MEEFTEIEEMVKVIEQAPDGVESGLLSSIAREIERGRTLASRTERVTGLIGRGALAVLASLVVLLRILGHGKNAPAVIVASLVGASVLAGLIYMETCRDRIQKTIAKVREEIGRTYKGLIPRYRL